VEDRSFSGRKPYSVLLLLLLTFYPPTSSPAHSSGRNEVRCHSIRSDSPSESMEGAFNPIDGFPEDLEQPPVSVDNTRTITIRPRPLPQPSTERATAGLGPRRRLRRNVQHHPSSHPRSIVHRRRRRWILPHPSGCTCFGGRQGRLLRQSQWI